MVDMKKLAQKAEERKTYDPALEFTPDGNKFAEGHARVRFLDIGFSVTKNPKPKTGQPSEFLTIRCELLVASDFGQQPGRYQLQTAAANSSLTDGILKLWTANGEHLDGITADIETYNYVHKTHGKTRGYRVNLVKE